MEPNPVNKVFGIAEVREMIMKRVILQNGKRSVADIRSCRLVNKAWLDSVSAYLHKSKKPLFKFRIDPNFFLNVPGTNNKDETEVAQFVDNMTDPNSVYLQFKRQRIPTFSLQIKAETFLPAMAGEVKNCLVKCGEGLVKLRIATPTKLNYYDFELQNIWLPNLRTLFVRLSTKDEDYRKARTAPFPIFKNHLEQLAVAMLPRCKNLKHCTFMSPYWVLNDIPERSELDHLVHSGFESALFPSSLETLDISCTMQNSHLENLGYILFPNLVRLTLHIPLISFEDGLLYRVLQNVAKTLKELYLKHMPCTQLIGGRLRYLRLPPLLKLEIFHSECTDLTFEDDLETSLKCMPHVTDLVLENQWAEAFLNWISTASCFKRITSLRFSIVEDDGESSIWGAEVCAYTMERVYCTFPNVTSLQFATFPEDFDGIRFVFKNMCQLQSMGIFVSGDNYNTHNSVAWDSLLIGISTESADKLRKDPELWNSSDFDKDLFPSIRNLKNLRKFKFGMGGPFEVPNQPPITLISDNVFKYAFLQMPNLKHIAILNGFYVSQEVKDTLKWKDVLLELNRHSSGKVVTDSLHE